MRRCTRSWDQRDTCWRVDSTGPHWRQFTRACQTIKARRAQRWKASLPTTPLNAHQTPAVGRPPEQCLQPADPPTARIAGTKRPGKPKAGRQPTVNKGRRETVISKKTGGTGNRGRRSGGNNDSALRNHNADLCTHPTTQREAETIARLEEDTTQLQDAVHELMVQAHAAQLWLRHLQLIAEGDVPKEENIVQQGGDSCGSALSWNA